MIVFDAISYVKAEVDIDAILQRAAEEVAKSMVQYVFQPSTTVPGSCSSYYLDITTNGEASR